MNLHNGFQFSLKHLQLVNVNLAIWWSQTPGSSKIDSSPSPSEIMRREVSWTLMKKLDSHEEVKTSICGSRWDQEKGGGAGLSWTLKRAQERSKAGRWSWAQKAGLLLLQLFISSCATVLVLVTLLHTAVETAIACYTSCSMQGPHCLNIVVLAVVHGLLGLSRSKEGWSARSSHSLFLPSPPPLHPHP